MDTTLKRCAVCGASSAPEDGGKELTKLNCCGALVCAAPEHSACARAHWKTCERVALIKFCA